MSTAIGRVSAQSPARGSIPFSWVVTSSGNFWGTVLLLASVNVTMFDLAQETEGEAFRIDPLLLLRMGACAAFGLFGLLYLPRTAAQLMRFPAAWNTMLLAWAALTVPISVSPTFSAAGVFTLACITLFVPAVLVQLGSDRTVKVLLAGLLIYIGLNWAVAIAAPNLVDTSFKTVAGETSHRFGNDPQQLGLQAAWAIGFCLILALNKQLSRGLAILLLCGMLLTLGLSLSRTAIVASLAVSGIALWPHVRAPHRMAAVAAGLIFVGVTAFVLSSGRVSLDSQRFVDVASRSGDTNELKTFTGRVDVWKYAWEKCLASPLFGYGYGTSRFVLQEDPNYPLQFQANHAHNLYLNTALTIGLPGALILIVMILHLSVHNMSLRYSVPSIALAFIVTGSITESLLYGAMPRSHAIIWLVGLFWQQMFVNIGGVRPDDVEEYVT
jgi:O-antigen ligase